MKRQLRRASSALILVAATGTAAHAAELTTSRLYRNGDHGLRCEATNVGKRPLPLVHMALIQNDGTEVNPNDCVDLGPNATCGVASADVGGGAFCRITFKGSARQVRGMISAYDLTNGSVVAIESAR